jgi:predicted AAA+ superfamily ATPase
MNVIDGYKLLEKYSAEIKEKTTISGWFGLAQSFHTSDLDKTLQSLYIKKTDMNWSSQIELTKKFVDDYINQKIYYPYSR